MDRRTGGWKYEIKSRSIIWLYRLISTCVRRWKSHAYSLGKYIRYETAWNYTLKGEELRKTEEPLKRIMNPVEA